MPHTIHLAAIKVCLIFVFFNLSFTFCQLLQEAKAISSTDAEEATSNYQEANQGAATSDEDGSPDGFGIDQPEDELAGEINMSAIGRVRFLNCFSAFSSTQLSPLPAS